MDSNITKEFSSKGCGSVSVAVTIKNLDALNQLVDQIENDIKALLQFTLEIEIEIPKAST